MGQNHSNRQAKTGFRRPLLASREGFGLRVRGYRAILPGGMQAILDQERRYVSAYTLPAATNLL
jgi:hypothetical protein